MTDTYLHIVGYPPGALPGWIRYSFIVLLLFGDLHLYLEGFSVDLDGHGT